MALWGDAARKSPTKARALNNFGVALFGRGRFAESLPLFERAVKLGRGYYSALQNLQQCLFRLRRYEEAARAAEDMLPFDVGPRGKVEALTRRGEALALAGRHADAEKSFRDALRFDSEFAAARSGLGEVLRRQGDIANAILVREELVRDHPEESDFVADLADLYIRVGRMEDAIAVAREHVRRAPDRAQAHFLLGTYSFNSQLVPAARAAFEEALRIDPRHAGAQIGLSAVYGESGEFDRSIAVLEELRLSGVASFDLYLNLAESHIRKADAVPETARDEFQKALAVFEEALQRPFPNENLAEIHYRLAKIFAAGRGLPDPNSRRQHARMAVALDPKHPEGRVLDAWARED